MEVNHAFSGAALDGDAGVAKANPSDHYYRMRHWSMPKIAKNLRFFAVRG